MENKNRSSKAGADRKTVEKNRRNQMKTLYTELNSLIPTQESKDQVMSLPDQLEMSISYIKKLEEKLERMKEKKDNLMGIAKERTRSMSGANMEGIRPPQVEIHSMGSALDVVLISGPHSQSMFYEIIRVLSEEGAEVVNASFSTVEDTVFHTIHSEVVESSLGIARVSRRLQNLVHEFTDAV